MNRFDPATFLSEFRREAEGRGFSCATLLETGAGPLLGFVRPGTGKPAYLSAGIHGDEPAGPLAALELLKAGAFDDGREWTLCPAVNPTGLAAGTRDTAAGFDINRDYLRRRTPEVLAHAAWLETRPTPGLFLSLHEDWETSGFYFYEINLADDRPDLARSILGAVSPWFPPEPSETIDDHEVRERGWIYHEARADFPDHWPEAIFLAESGCPLSFTFETPSSARMEDRIAAHVAAAKAVLKV
ncbi:M14 family metallocarboxypeptidase [Haloferula sp. A504]|uniref:M14 family metallocarboxypeptidase n=1 Tax=Haloferula sp. A504 TaxID=3373601 RepID=UPI0031C67E73|nr:M14 family metallocarboxypeptidase [Verrucomicrobiaceae bacterium E54]